MEINPDYVTILPAFPSRREQFLVAVRTYSAPVDDYITRRLSSPLRREAADSLAQSWAAALKVDVR